MTILSAGGSGGGSSLKGSNRSTHRVAKRMIERLEKKESIQVDHSKFAKLALDPTLSLHIPWTLPGCPRIDIEEKYSMNFWRAMNTPGDRIRVFVTMRHADSGLIYESKILAKTGRDFARKMIKDGIAVVHHIDFGNIPGFTTNAFTFEIIGHFSNYRALLQPLMRSMLKVFPPGETAITVTHVQLESYARSVVLRDLKNAGTGDHHPHH
ncbi:MAG: hypothetical protein H7249_06215 [Chitinophagaceae bacterium]|nr:hypothetical protein [Oligoflexus sp.]